jgi:hypothetical protein
MTTHLKTALPALICGLALVQPLAAMAADCPSTSTAPDGFTIERNHMPTDVAPAGDQLVHTIFRTSSGTTLLETTTFAGLFELERIDRGRRSVFHTTTNLAALLPLKVGKTLTATFDPADAPQAAKTKMVLHVARTDSLFIESCKYSVFVIERSIGLSGAAPVFAETDFTLPTSSSSWPRNTKTLTGAPIWLSLTRSMPRSLSSAAPQAGAFRFTALTHDAMRLD